MLVATPSWMRFPAVTSLPPTLLRRPTPVSSSLVVTATRFTTTPLTALCHQRLSRRMTEQMVATLVAGMGHVVTLSHGLLSRVCHGIQLTLRCTTTSSPTSRRSNFPGTSGVICLCSGSLDMTTGTEAGSTPTR